MGDVIVVTSGKADGEDYHYGKFGNRSGKAGLQCVLVDTDIGLRNLDVVMGLRTELYTISLMLLMVTVA